MSYATLFLTVINAVDIEAHRWNVTSLKKKQKKKEESSLLVKKSDQNRSSVATI